MIKRRSIAAATAILCGCGFVAEAGTLPTPLAAAALAAPSDSGMDLGLWQDYTRQALLPDFSANFGYRVQINLGLLASHEHLLVPSFAQAWNDEAGARQLTFDFGEYRLAGNYYHSGDQHRFGGLSNPASTVSRDLFAAGVQREVGEHGLVDVAAVFAHQSYAAWGLGSQIANQGTTTQPRRLASLREQSAGTGVRLGFSSEVAPGFQLGATYQSRIDMDAFQTYRGVYSEPGDFDLPATANLAIVVDAGEKASLSFDVQRVLYSEVPAITTAGLPDRVLSLLGDSGSPEFAWDDLTVYRLGWNYRQGDEWDWNVTYSTSQQPNPSSTELSRALEDELADRSVSVGFSRQAGKNGRLHFLANYAPSEYYLGPTNYGQVADFGQDQFEFEVRFVWDL